MASTAADSHVLWLHEEVFSSAPAAFQKPRSAPQAGPEEGQGAGSESGESSESERMREGARVAVLLFSLPAPATGSSAPSEPSHPAAGPAGAVEGSRPAPAPEASGQAGPNFDSVFRQLFCSADQAGRPKTGREGNAPSLSSWCSGCAGARTRSGSRGRKRRKRSWALEALGSAPMEKKSRLS